MWWNNFNAIGATVPSEIVPPTFPIEYEKELLYEPTLVAIGRETDEIFLFDISIHHESEIEPARKVKMNTYGPLIEAIKRAMSSSSVNLYTLEIGSSLGQMSETTKFSIWQFFRLTTKSTNMDIIISNMSTITKLSSFKLFKVWLIEYFAYKIQRIITFYLRHTIIFIVILFYFFTSTQLRYETRWDRRMRYLYPCEKASIWSTTTESFMDRRKGYRRRGCIRGYIVPLLKLIAACIVVGFGITLLYVSGLILKWFWSQLTVKIIVIMILVLVGLSLQLFRP